MLTINLLPKNFQSKMREQRIKNAYIETGVVAIVVVIILVVGLVATNIILSMLTNDANRKIETSKQELKKYADFEKEVKIYQENGKLYDTLTQDKYDWPEVISYINGLVPSGVQITQFKLSVDKENVGTKIIEMSGQAKDRREIAVFVNKMKAEERLDEVEFTVGGTDESGIIDFQIKSNLIK